MLVSPYDNASIDRWHSITEELIAKSPLSLEDIRDLSIESWGELWATKIGVGASAIPLVELGVPATVVGYFFEKLFITRLYPIKPREQGRKINDPVPCRELAHTPPVEQSSLNTGTAINAV